MSAEPIIKIKDLNVVYFLGKSNEVRALKNINLEIYPGEFIIFFGPSGCGKSTLLYSIAGLETNTHGDIVIGGKELSTMNNNELEKFHGQEIGMIFQAYYLINSLSIVNNVILPQVFLEKDREERKKKALSLLDYFGVRAQADKLPSELSGGQQQRVAICRALMNDPDIILADEPIGNLDSSSADEVMRLLGGLNDDQKKTIILVTHNPDHLRFAHRVFYMKDGYIIEKRVNKVVDRSIQKIIEDTGYQQPEISKDLELLLRTYTSLSSAQAGNLLVPFKAKQIVLEAFMGMTSEDIDRIEKKVENLLLRGINDNNEILDFLDVDDEKGGMGFDRRRALQLAEKIKEIVGEIKFLEEEESKAKENKLVDTEQDIIQVRKYLLDSYDVKIENIDSLKKLDTLIKQRIDNEIDKAVFQKALDLPLKKNGVGLNAKTAKKITRRLELLILGKYK